jgi:hypothetical protein
MKKIILGLISLAMVFGLAGVANAAVNAVTPSTNDINRTNGWAHVDQLSVDVGSTNLQFISTRAFYSCFEYRTDGNTSQVITENGGVNYNTNITDGLYPYFCENNSNETATITANEYVEIRMVFGAETDERFDWTRFDVLPKLEDLEAPTVPANLRWVNKVGGLVACGSEITDLVAGAVKADWDDSTDNVGVDHYEYVSFNPPNGWAWPSLDSGSVVTNSEYGDTSYIPSVGMYGFMVRAVDSAGNKSAWTDANKTIGDSCQITFSNAPVLVGPPTNKDQCKKNGWKTFNNPSFKNQGQCEKYVKDHKENGKVKGDIQMSTPSQKIKFDLSEKEISDFKYHKGKKNQVEYWNYEYPGVLHYKADALCVNVDKVTKEARFMVQIPSGWPGLTGLYVVFYVKDINQKGVADLYGHNATSDLTTATTWCETGVGFNPAMYSVTKGKVEVK